MMKLKIQNEVIEVSERKKTYCLMYGEFQVKVKAVQDFYEKSYKKFGNLKNLSEGITSLTVNTVGEVYKSMAYLLDKYTNTKIDFDPFYDLFSKTIDEYFERFEDYYNIAYESISKERQDKMDYRKARMDNRRMWVGYNKAGQQEANARNFRSWAAHSARNAVGNTATNISTSMQMNEVYNDKEMMKEQLEAVKKFCFDVFGYYVNQLKVLEDSPIEVIYSKDYEAAEENFKAVKNMEAGSTENLALIKKIVETVPNRQDVYQYIISNYGDSDNAVCDFAKEIGINLENWKVAQAEERVKKDKVNDLSSEQKILAAIKVIKDDCKYWGVNPDTYTAELNILWEKIDEKLRTVEGTLYETREESDAVRGDIRYLWEYSMQNNMLSEKFDLQSIVGELSANVKTEAVKSNLAERINNLAAWQNLKNIQYASMQIASASPVYDKVKGELWFGDLFSYGKTFENLRGLFADNNKNAVLHDNGTMSKGKMGLLFASNGVYFYSKDGIVNIELEDYEGMELSQGEIIIHRKNEDAIKTGIKVKIEQLNSFMICDLFDTIVQMCRSIKNKDQIIEDSEVYFAVSREKSNKKVNKEDLTQEDRELLLGKKILIGILAVIAVVVALFVFGRGGKDQAENVSTNVETAETDSTESVTGEVLQQDGETETNSDITLKDTDIDDGDELVEAGSLPEGYCNIYNLESENSEKFMLLQILSIDETGVTFTCKLFDDNEDLPFIGKIDQELYWIDQNYQTASGTTEYGECAIVFLSDYNIEANLDDEHYFCYSYTTDLTSTFTVSKEYIFPESSEDYLTRDDLYGLSAEECKIARNEIYARHGRIFNDEDLQNHFNHCSWYEGTIQPDDFSEGMLNEIELANLQTISEYELEMGYK